MRRFVERLGYGVTTMGCVVVGSTRALPRVRWGAFVDAMGTAGLLGAPLAVGGVALAGAVVALQSAAQLARFGAAERAMDLVALSMVRELGPVLGALLMAGRSGARVASELGTRVAGGQVDALRAAGGDPWALWAAPALWGGALGVFGVLVLAMAGGLAGGWVLLWLRRGTSLRAFAGRLAESVHPGDLGEGLLKSACFAAIVAVVAVAWGLRPKDSAPEVAADATGAVVAATALVLLGDLVLTAVAA